MQIPFESGTQALSRRQLLQVACGELQEPELLMEQLGRQVEWKRDSKKPYQEPEVT